jgi:hypothetical protein
MQILLSNVPDPRNLRVWKVGLKDWVRAGDVQELAALIQKPPPLPQPGRSWADAWRSAAAVALSLAVVWVVSDYLLAAPLAALPLVLALDWATRRRRRLLGRVR